MLNFSQPARSSSREARSSSSTAGAICFALCDYLFDHPRDDFV
jgi:hypothetical protein